MTGFNHAAIGAVIGATVNPYMAIPAAFVSHFVADALPHFGIPNLNDRKKPRFIWLFLTVLKFDVVGLFALTVWLVMKGDWIVLLSALAAFSPDFAWVYRYIVTEKWGKLPPQTRNRFNDFHVRIQRFETPWGYLIEAPLAVALVVLIGRLV
ncbi:MAG: hypothetical protein M3Q79_02285 [bacterium]|nr:hypothetical protein [bacterium]